MNLLDCVYFWSSVGSGEKSEIIDFDASIYDKSIHYKTGVLNGKVIDLVMITNPVCKYNGCLYLSNPSFRVSFEKEYKGEALCSTAPADYETFFEREVPFEIKKEILAQIGTCIIFDLNSI